MKGQRGGDIGCESEPVSEFFQLRPEECKDNRFEILTNGFILHAQSSTIAGILPTFTPVSKAFIADARKWSSLEELLTSQNTNSDFPVAVGEITVDSDTKKSSWLFKIDDRRSTATAISCGLRFI